MSDSSGTQEKQKAAKVRRKPVYESVLRPTFAATRYNASGTLWGRNQPESGLLQRQCACGTHTIGGGECDACRQKRESSFLQRATVHSIPDNEELQGQVTFQTYPVRSPGYDFSQVPVHTSSIQMQASSDLTNKTVQLNVSILDRANDTVSRDIARANQVFRPAGLTITVSNQQTLNRNVSREILRRVNDDNALESYTRDEEGTPQFSDEERELIRHNFRSRMINVYYVPRVTNRSLGGYTISGIRLDPIIVIDSSVSGGFGALEHEIGHALGLPHNTTDHFNLMYPGVRAGSRLASSDITRIRGSRYAQ